jgi:hypothetical protein
MFPTTEPIFLISEINNDYYAFVVLEIEPRALHVVDKCSTTDLGLQP